MNGAFSRCHTITVKCLITSADIYLFYSDVVSRNQDKIKRHCFFGIQDNSTTIHPNKLIRGNVKFC